MGNNAELKEQGFSENVYEKAEVTTVETEGQNPENLDYKELM